MVGLVAAGLALAFPFVVAGAWSSGVGATEPAVLARHLALVLLVPVAEELYFRGILLERLAASFGPVTAVGAVGPLFGLLHWPQGLLLPMTVLSIVLCAVALATRSVLWAVTLHVGWNAAAVVRSLPRGPERWAIAGAAAGAIVIVSLLALRRSADPEP